MQSKDEEPSVAKNLLTCIEIIKTRALPDGSPVQFVALDLEMSGLTKDPTHQKRDEVLEEYYAKQRDGAASFGLLQLGVSIAGRVEPTDGEETGEWYIHTDNFYLFPRRQRQFRSDTASLLFLSDSGFSFDKWIQDGVDYEAINDIEKEKSMPESMRVIDWKDDYLGIHQIIQAIIETATPLFLHNGLMDLLHIVDKFITSLPKSCPTIADLAQLVLECLPGGVYDTKYIAKRALYALLPNQASTTTLPSLYEQLEKPNRNIVFNLLGPLADKYRVAEDHDGHTSTSLNSHLHEAGYDSLLTAKVAILEIHSLLRISNMGECIQAVQCSYCKNHIMCRYWKQFLDEQKLSNCVDLYVSPGFFNLVSTLVRKKRSLQGNSHSNDWNKVAKTHKVGGAQFKNKTWTPH